MTKEDPHNQRLVSKKTLWAGYIMSAVPVLMLLMSATMKFVKPAAVVEGFGHLGLPGNLALGLGVVELACTVVYVIPRTSVLGAILLTGYLGGLFLRNPWLREQIPLKR